MLELEELKSLHDDAYVFGQVTREKASNDLVFYYITQWDDSLNGVNLSYRGQFDQLRKAGRQITSDMTASPIQIDFEPMDQSRDDSADFAQGVYLTDEQNNQTIQAYENAMNECVVCGFGAWKVFTEYKTTKMGLEEQVIRRKPIREAVNTVFFDPNSYLIDRSDAKYVSVLSAYSENGYYEMASELTGKPIEEIEPVSFSEPEQSYVFPWVAGGTDKKVYVTEFYIKETVKDKILTLSDPLGSELNIYESQLEDMEDDLLNMGYDLIDERKVERDQVVKYIASGTEILSVDEMPCEDIPVIPMYGEFAYVEGEIHYEGIVRLAKDPQRLRNFQMSYLADIVSRSPRPKPIFFPEQIRGFEFMFEENGSDNNFPFIYQNRKSQTGEDLPIGPVAQMPEQPMPSALAQSIALTREAVDDVANAGQPQDIADPDLSGKAVLALQARVDQQSMVYQTHRKYSKRYDAKVYAQIASVVIDTPRQVTLTLPDGTRKQAKVMEQVIDRDTGQIKVLNDITNMEWEVYADIGQSYASQREQNMERLESMAQNIAPYNPEMAQNIMLTQLTLMDGAGTNDIRDNARKQLVMSGFKEPETPEEEQMVAAAAQQQQGGQDILMQAEAQARLMEGQAAMQNEINDADGNRIDMFKAETDRLNTQIKAAEAGVKMENTKADTDGKRIDNATKVGSVLMQRIGVA